MEELKELFPNLESDVVEAIYKETGNNVNIAVNHLLEINSQIYKDERSVGSVNDKNHFKKSNWKDAVLVIPENFLRLTESDDIDEFAVMLQNEEFLNELRFNQEFLSTLESEQGKFHDERFEDRLKNMGKSGKRKFYQLAKLFSFQRNKKNVYKGKLFDE